MSFTLEEKGYSIERKYSIDLTLKEMQQLMVALNLSSSYSESCDCDSCVYGRSAKKKLEEMIAVATLDEIDKGLPIPEWMAKLGVVKREIVKPGEE